MLVPRLSEHVGGQKHPDNRRVRIAPLAFSITYSYLIE